MFLVWFVVVFFCFLMRLLLLLFLFANNIFSLTHCGPYSSTLFCADVLCACLLSYCCSWRTHNYCAALGVYNFIPYRNIVNISCRRHRRRCRRSFGRRAREHCAHTVSLSALCISHTYIVHIHNLVCASRVSNSPYDYILYFAFHIISSTAPADYIVTDFAVVYVHAHECVVCSGCYVVFFCFSSLLLLYVTHNKRDDIVLAG